MSGWRRKGLTLLALAALLGVIGWAIDRARREAPAAAPAGPPAHLVLTLFDTLRADRMSVYGHEARTTPFLDELAAESVVFEGVKATGPWTVPSHASLFTGLLPAVHRAQWGRMRLDDEFVTLAEVLAEQGFCTVGISSNPLASGKTGLDQGFDSYEVITGPWATRTERTLDRLPDILERVEREGCRLFLFLNLMDTHIPYNTLAHGEEFGLIDRGGPVQDAATKWAISAGARPFDAADRAQHAAAYDAAVRAGDDAARRLHSILREGEVLERTLLVFTSDHGDGLGDHPELGHSISVWEEQLGVPLLARFPGGRRGGRVERGPGSLASLFDSLLGWLEVGDPRRDDPRVEKAGAGGQGAVVADYRSYFSERNRNANTKTAERYPELAARITHRHVVYCGRYKLVAGARGDISFYDLLADPGEQRDLAAAGHPELSGCARQYARELAAGRLTPFDSDAGEETPTVDLETLKSLGYVQ